MLPYAGYVDPESTLAIGVHHDGHLEATEPTSPIWPYHVNGNNNNN